MNTTLGLLDRNPGSGDVVVGGGGLPAGGSVLSRSKKANNLKDHNMSIEDSSSYRADDHDGDDGDDLELGLGLGLGLSNGGSLKTKEEASRILTGQNSSNLKPSSSSSSSSVSFNTCSIVGNKRTAIHSVSPNANSVVGWPPIRKAHLVPIMANRLKSEHEEFSSRLQTKNRTNSNHLTVKVNMDGTLIGRKIDLYAHTSYETLAQTLENMFHGTWSSTEAVGCSRLLNGTSEFVLTYEDKDGDCMLVGDVPWQMFLSSVKRLRILRNPKMQR